MAKKRKKRDKRILEWLGDQVESHETEAEMEADEAELYRCAEEQYAKTGTLPRDIRREYVEMLGRRHYREDGRINHG